MRLLTIFLALAWTVSAAAQSVVDTWQPKWTAYTLVDDNGAQRRLLKAVVRFQTQTQLGQNLVLLDQRGVVLDEALVPTRTSGVWPHGFWIPGVRRVTLQWRDAGKVLESRSVDLPVPKDPPVLPLRMDRLNRSLLKRLITREAAAEPPAVAGLPAYLAQHDVIYRHPSDSWVDGLPLGNGDVGALVSGTEGREQVFHLDKTDIWYAAPDGTGLGRSYAGTIRVRYRGGAGPFEQRLSLARAEVDTKDGAFQSAARVHALRNVVEAEVKASDAEIEVERSPVTLWVNRRSGYKNAEMLFGSWATGTTRAQLAALREEAARAPHTTVEWGQAGDTCWFLNSAPNMRYAVAVRITGAPVVWKGRTAAVRGPFRMRAAVATSRDSDDPVAAARALLGNDAPRAAHLEWWSRFWSRSWIDLPDKFEENLWYIGLYQQAACSRSDQAVSFFGLWHPLDYRTWYDAYVADAQVPMIWWQTFGSNHLELLYPSHRTFGRAVSDFVRRTPGEGMVVPHFFLPEWAGGNDFFIGKNPHKGSVPWYALNFWWDYLYSGDRDFLREVTYPILRMGVDWLVADLVKEGDGKYHCVGSGSPEQNNTARDNIYDWAMIRAFLLASIRASEILDVDSGPRVQWRDRLDHLFPAPTDGKTLAETLKNPHPYRCHPVVFFGLFPSNAIEYGSPLFESARRTMPVVTTPLGFRYEDRHAAIPNYLGGIEPNGFSSGILTISAARLGDRELYRRLFYGLIVRFHLKQNGLRALVDTRQSDDISRSSLVEAANAHTTAITESLLQSWDDHVRLFPCVQTKGRVRFSGLRAAGGFVVSAEARDGRLRWATVQSTRDTTLTMALPPHDGLTVREQGGAAAAFQWVQSKYGERRLQIACRAGKTYSISGPADFNLIAVSPRNEPRAVEIAGLENVGLLQYPEDLPFGQIERDTRLYLGIPAAYGSPRPVPDLEAMRRLAEDSGWQIRQTAARLLARVPPSAEVLTALDHLCGDSMNLVAHTAAVSLVHIGTTEALALAEKHAAKDAVPGLRREVEKARIRLHR